MKPTDYDELYRDFTWKVPKHFNFGSTIDEYAKDPARVALLYEDQEGNRARLTFADLSRQSNQIANALAGLGLKPGATILLMLPRITLWQAAYIGALKAGLMVIPCTSMLREKDVVYRATHSGAQAIIASPSASELISDLRNKCPSLQHFLVAGSDR